MWLPVAAVGVTSAGVGVLADSGIDPTSLTQYGVGGLIAAIGIVTVRWLYNKQATDWDRERTQLIDELADTKIRADARVADVQGRADSQVADERARGDRLEGELSRLNTMVQTQVLAALNEATRAVSDAIAAVRSGRR